MPGPHDSNQPSRPPGDDVTAASAGATADVGLNDALLRKLRIRIPGYKLLGVIGRGGQATVYKAIEQTDSRMPVAIKILHAGPLADPTARERLRREARAMRALIDSPNIVSAFADGQTEEGHDYLIMNYIDGKPLDEFWKHRRPGTDDPEESAAQLQLFKKICDAVALAHRRGITHRDLSPSNILVDEQGEPHILDFGLARTAFDQFNSPEMKSISVTGQFIGKLAYASPEQASGVSSAIDVRTDVYALGVMLYQVLTGGRYPYRVVGTLLEVLNNIIHVAPVRPSEAVEAGLAQEIQSRRTLRPTRSSRINRTVEEIVLKALAKRPEDRYQTAGELAAEIGRYLAGKPTLVSLAGQSSEEPNPPGHTTRVWRHAAAWLLVVAALAAGSAAWVSEFGNRHRPAVPPTAEAASPSWPAATKPAQQHAPDPRLPASRSAATVVEQGALDDRQIAERVLELGGTLMLAAGYDNDVKWDRLPLPATPFKVTGILFSAGRRHPTTDGQLAFLRGNTTVRELILSFVKITDQTMLNVVATMPNLDNLCVRGDAVTDRGIAVLPNLHRLVALNVVDTQIDDEGLATIGKLTGLQNLHISGNARITDKGLAALAGLTKLQRLGLSGTSTTDAGLAELAPAVRPNWIGKSVDMTTATIRRLFPGCRTEESNAGAPDGTSLGQGPPTMAPFAPSTPSAGLPIAARPGPPAISPEAPAEIVRRFSGFPAAIGTLAFDPHNRWLHASRSSVEAGPSTVWDLLDGHVALSDEDVNPAMVFSPDGEWCFTPGALVSLTHGQRRDVGTAMGGFRGQFSADGGRFGGDGTIEDPGVRVYRVSDGAKLFDQRAFFPSWMQGYSVDLSPDGRRVAAAGGADTGPNDRGIEIWDVDAQRELPRPRWTGGAKIMIRFSADGNQLCVVQAATVKVFDVATGQTIRSFEVSARVAPTNRSVLLRPGGNVLVAHWQAGDGVSISTWDASTGSKLVEKQIHPDGEMPTPPAFSDDGRRMLTIDPRGIAVAWDMRRVTPLGRCITKVGGAITALAISPDGTLGAAGDALGNACVWRLP